MSNIGIMDPAYFVGKNAILKFYNDTLALNLSKIEQTANCSAHCQLLDALYPGKVPLHKVNFDAKYEYEYVTNFKVLQSVFDSEGITKHVDVPKLIKAKYQDNLEFCQWMKSFYESRSNGNSMYNAIERRQQAMSQYKKGHKHAGSSKLPGTSAAPKPAAVSAAPAVQAAKPAAVRSAVTSPATVKAAASKPKVSVGNTSARRTSKPASPNSKAAPVDNAELVKLQVTLETMQRERDFYFGKLREIEILCQQDDATADTAMAALKKQLLDILYHSDGDEFQQPTEGEENDENRQPTDEHSGEVGETFGDLGLDDKSADEQKQATADDEGLLAL